MSIKIILFLSNFLKESNIFTQSFSKNPKLRSVILVAFPQEIRKTTQCLDVWDKWMIETFMLLDPLLNWQSRCWNSYVVGTVM